MFVYRKSIRQAQSHEVPEDLLVATTLLKNWRTSWQMYSAPDFSGQ